VPAFDSIRADRNAARDRRKFLRRNDVRAQYRASFT
jgi:hypothetical protein